MAKACQIRRAIKGLLHLSFGVAMILFFILNRQLIYNLIYLIKHYITSFYSDVGATLARVQVYLISIDKWL